MLICYMKRRLIIILLVIIFAKIELYPQTSLMYNFRDSSAKQIYLSEIKTNSPVIDPLKREIDYGRLYLIGGATLGLFTAAHIYQANLWWDAKPNKKLRIQWEGDYALYMDKSSHFIASHFLTHYLTASMEAANIETRKSVWYASVISFLYETYVEIEDGTTEGFTLAPDDLIADFLGSGYHLAQYYFPYLKNFQPRISYYPSSAIRNSQTKENFLDDYEGQKHWLAIKVKELLPESISKYWPSFLMVSFGSGLKNYFTNKQNMQREFFIALDFDPDVLPIFGEFGEFIKNSLAYVHFPMPGIRISPNTAVLLFCY